MPLQSGLSSFKSAIEGVFKNNKNTPAQCAQGIARAVKDWAIQGIPMTTHLPSLTGSGGIDSVSPGPGLSSVKAKLQADIEAGFKSRSNTAAMAAKVFTDAHMDFFSKASVMTMVVATVTPPAGTPYAGSGTGGIDKSTPGQGLSAALPSYISTLEGIFANNSKNNTISTYAKKMADASFTFLSAASISTTDSGATGAGGASLSGTIS